jgi:hypothetical protein
VALVGGTIVAIPIYEGRDIGGHKLAAALKSRLYSAVLFAIKIYYFRILKG